MEAGGSISAAGWAKGIGFSVLASIIGSVSKLAIRKSWLLLHEYEEQQAAQPENADAGEISSADDLLVEERRHQSDCSATENEQALPGNIAWWCSSLCKNHRESSSSCCSRRLCFSYGLRYSGMFGMIVLNPVCCVLAMNHASPSILAPFSGLTLCWVIVGSPYVNNEHPSSQQILACALIIAGEVIVALFGDHTNDDGVTMEEVRNSYKTLRFQLYFVGLLAYISTLSYWIFHSKSPVLRRFAWGSCGGSITGAQNFLKDSLTIFKDSATREESIPWYFYVFIICAAGTALSGLLILTACMKRYDGTYSAASFVGSFVVSASIMAAAHYNTFANLPGLLNYILYPLGLVVLMVGVYLLVKDSSHSPLDNRTSVGVNENDAQESEVSNYQAANHPCFVADLCKFVSYLTFRPSVCLDTLKSMKFQLPERKG